MPRPPDPRPVPPERDPRYRVPLELIAAILALRRGECWCGVGIGDPQYGGTHGCACQEMQEWMRRLHA